MEKQTKGVTIAGVALVDVINMIDKYPEKNMLTQIKETSMAVGGCVPNTLISLSKIDKDVPLSASFKIGDDDYGKYIVEQLKLNGIDTSRAIVDKSVSTSYTQVMTEIPTGDRTFFTNMAANAAYGVDDVDVDKLDCEIFHAGYILLLDELDSEDAEFGTKMARLLNKVSSKGIKTSIDIVSVEDEELFKRVVIPAVKQCDYVIINEVESGRITGLSPRNADDSLNMDNIRKTMEQIMSYGVREKVIVHSTEMGALLDRDGNFVVVPSLQLPKGWIKGSTGAGDCYCAACLYGLTQGFDNERLLAFAAGAAATNLTQPDSVSGVKSKEEIEEINRTLPRRSL